MLLVLCQRVQHLFADLSTLEPSRALFQQFHRTHLYLCASDGSANHLHHHLCLHLDPHPSPDEVRSLLFDESDRDEDSKQSNAKRLYGGIGEGHGTRHSHACEAILAKICIKSKASIGAEE